MPGPADTHKAPHKAAQPNRTLFDPWNSSSTGHQRADNRLAGSTAWRDSRSAKLAVQLSDASAAGGKRVSDTVGAGSETFGTDGRTANGSWMRGAPGLRDKGQLSLFECQARVEKKPARTTTQAKGKRPAYGSIAPAIRSDAQPDTTNNEHNRDDDSAPPSAQPAPAPAHNPSAAPPQLFRGVTVYINGSTYPEVSDHALRRLLATHGATLSLHLARRTVTHVVLGTCGAGGGALAAGKLQREIARRHSGGGGSVKFVAAAWVLESVRAGRRLAEGRFAVVRAATGAQGCVRDGLGA